MTKLPLESAPPCKCRQLVSKIILGFGKRVQEIDCYPLKALKKGTHKAKLLRMNTVRNRQQDRATQENGSTCCISVVRKILQIA
jgi:hypothetical protein